MIGPDCSALFRIVLPWDLIVLSEKNTSRLSNLFLLRRHIGYTFTFLNLPLRLLHYSSRLINRRVFYYNDPGRLLRFEYPLPHVAGFTSEL